MLPRSRPGRAAEDRRPRVCGVRTHWTTVADGEFHCPDCGGDRNYQRRTGRRRLTLLGLPVLPRGEAGPVVECASCAGHFPPEVLTRPTTTRFSALLRDAVHTVALAVLAAGGTGSRTALAAAVEAVRDAGDEECTAERLTAVADALAADTGRRTGGEDGEAPLAAELHEALDPLAPHLADLGRASLLLRAAGIALADGPYTPAERDVLTTVGAALTLPREEVADLLTAARTPS
ncbi:hypothetical protein C0Q58_22660 [Streptomyces albidoflavus]|uniref:TerB family tellurite resistance protein n=1 Tax=Streptomyces albidoflavus TaxID=1886 RepID=UPI00101E82F4|nr:TerB family tellurite resistance protein [Streptomyces albidoflavus]RZD58814.1 hypothetical protein C0Q58_22660 [Streptomyces albidoflavus]